MAKVHGGPQDESIILGPEASDLAAGFVLSECLVLAKRDGQPTVWLNFGDVKRLELINGAVWAVTDELPRRKSQFGALTGSEKGVWPGGAYGSSPVGQWAISQVADVGSFVPASVPMQDSSWGYVESGQIFMTTVAFELYRAPSATMNISDAFAYVADQWAKYSCCCGGL